MPEPQNREVDGPMDSPPPSNGEVAVTYIDCQEALDLDKELMDEFGAAYSLPQLMELAGLSVASGMYELFQTEKDKSILILVGPGNNGGDALVAARHLLHFGFTNISIIYPVLEARRRFKNLVAQLAQDELPVFESFVDLASSSKGSRFRDGSSHGSGLWIARHFDVILDGLFGVGYTPPMRPNFEEIVNAVNESLVPVVSIDVPSGWSSSPEIGTNGSTASIVRISNVHTLISLSVPKSCAINIKAQHHLLGGRFVPKKIARQRGYCLPKYPGTAQIVSLDRHQLVAHVKRTDLAP